jgi:predicted GIY-YIG superfamily endonuclease/rubredoxin
MYCCYLLKSERLPSCKATYIGFSSDPLHRLRQHNGEIVSGARKTSKYRPWKHVAIVSGFPSHHTALQFEWQWQHPNKSRIADVSSSSSSAGYKRLLAILAHLLQTSLWRRLDLTVYVFSEQYHRDFISLLCDTCTAPLILTSSTAFAEVMSTALSQRDRLVQQPVGDCRICGNRRYQSEHRYWRCPDCAAHCHLICLAEQPQARDTRGDPEQSKTEAAATAGSNSSKAGRAGNLQGISAKPVSLVPDRAVCPGCKSTLAWADAVRASAQVLDLAFSTPCCGALEGSDDAASDSSGGSDEGESADSEVDEAAESDWGDKREHRLRGDREVVCLS